MARTAAQIKYAKSEKRKEKNREANKRRREKLRESPELYEAYLERQRSSQKRYRAKHKAKVLAEKRSPAGRYYSQKGNAKHRGIPWEFSFETWWAMWEPHWSDRGRQDASMQMCRYGDKGAYSPDNCRIVSKRENQNEYLEEK